MTSPKTLLSLFTLFFFHLTVLSLFSADDAAVMAKLAANLSPTPSDWTGTDYCKWTGIRCDNSNRVTSINLSSRSLSGSLPSDLNQLTQLKTLSLWKNNLSGSLPSLANLTSLEKIILNGNNFTSIPSDFFMGLTNLQTMSLSDNPSLSPWTIPKDLTQSNSLSTFFASNANLVGSIPDFFYSFPSLQNLRLSYNNLTGPLPATLGSSEIQNLWLNNQLLGLSGTIDVLSSMTQISQVWLQANGFTGPIPDLSQCANLFDLQLRENQFTGVVPATLTLLPLLANVSLQSNKLQGPVPVFGNGVTVTLGTANSFCKSTPGPCDSQVTTLLEVAGAIGYPISLAESWEGNDACQRWTFITCDSQGKNVSSVNFGKQHFSGTISPAFANLTSLRALYLNDNNLSGSIPDSLTTLPQFQILDVSNNNLSGQVPVFPSNVKLTATGNLLLGENTTSDGGGSGGTPASGDKKRNTKVIIRIVVIVGSVAIAMICIYLSWRWMAKPRGRKTKIGKSVFKRRKVSADSTESTLEDNLNKVRLEDLPLFSFDELAIATDEFHVSNKLGQGGFGPVYKGKLSSGQEIAVKRLSRFSGQGMEEFMNEVVVISQLQHRNLVRLLGCSVEREEKMLIYEYMPNKSLDAFLFDPIKQKLLDWRKRANIIEGIGRGLLYLHRDSRLRIIHRDLKTSNVLLDENLNPKISDFGMAKIFGGNQDQANTRRVVGTYGYMAPEYAMQGRFSEKSDVFSFGVLLLEIVSGRKNTSFYHDEHCLSLLEFAWKLWNEDRIVMLIDSTIPDPCFQVEILRYIHVGLLCVQEFATNRPTISNILSMLSSEIANLPTPKKPAFTETRDLSNTLSSQQSQRRCSVNNVTVTTIDGR